jgi:predicted nucleic-acid-binding protein
VIGLDTNVLIRILTNDDLAQKKAASDYLASRCSETDPAFVSREVILEAVWVLERSFDYGRSDVARAIQAVLETVTFAVEDADLVAAANRDYVAGADFADAMIAAVNLASGCVATATFDRRVDPASRTRRLSEPSA